MESTSSACTVASLTCSQLALTITGIIIGIALIYINKTWGGKSMLSKIAIDIYNKGIDLVKEKSPKKKENKQESGKLEKKFSLLLITTSEKIRDKIEVGKAINGEYNQSVQTEIVKNLIKTSRYFLIEDANNNILSTAKTSDNLPDIAKDNLFILKITGKGKYNISTQKTKLGLRDSITSENCNIEKVLHLLDARITEKFIQTI